MGWNYRVIKKTWKHSGETEFSIHEVYYDDEGNPKSVTVEAVPLHGETFLELHMVAGQYLLALDRPVLDFEDFSNSHPPIIMIHGER